ncbi:MAG: transglutaminase domain-containing protein [Ekhidna sp.]|nr:transglutaminase domain-containing protein [Ekhidna sp.]
MEIRKALMVVAFVLCGTLQVFSQVDQWMISKLEGNPVGYYYMDEQSEGDIKTSTLNTAMVLNRMNSKIELKSEVLQIEDAEGMKKVEYSLVMSDQETKTVAEVIEGGIKITSSVQGSEFEQTIENDKPLYGPSLIKKTSLEQLKEVGDQISYHTYMPEFGKVVEIKRILTAKRPDRLEVKDLIDGFPETIYHLDRAGNTILIAVRLPFGMLETSVSSREIAESAVQGTILPDEMFDDTMIRNNVRFADARSIDELVVKISGKDKSLGLPDLEGANQEVLEKTDDYLILKITRPTVDFEGLSKPTASPDMIEFFQPNTYITSNDLEIMKVAENVSTGNVYEDCLNLRNWVTQNMSFDMGVMLAPASEVIKNRKGTCSEYTTLLTSLYRASNLPARMAMGFVYMSGIWGGHAWPEVYIDDQWVPFDAAIPGTDVADAARLRFVASSLVDGLGDLNAESGIQMYGNAIIETLSYTIDGKEYTNLSSAAYSIQGEHYTNEGLGLEVSIPAAFSFEDQDSVWPEKKFLTVAGSLGEKVSFYQKSIDPGQDLTVEMERELEELTGGTVKKKKGELQSYAADGDVYAISIPVGNEYILITYEGENAKELANSVETRLLD